MEEGDEGRVAYIKDIYAIDAQASGLLVIASYNWGETADVEPDRTMPANPRERNFWKVLGRIATGCRADLQLRAQYRVGGGDR